MIEESEIRNHKTNEYLGLWVMDRNSKSPKYSLIFNPHNLKRLEELDDLVQLTVGYEMISAGEFKREHLADTEFHIILDPNDAQPAMWAVYREIGSRFIEHDI